MMCFLETIFGTMKKISDTFSCKTDIWLYLSGLVLLLAFISSVFHLILVKLIIVFLCFYNNKSRLSLGVFTVEPFCMQM